MSLIGLLVLVLVLGLIYWVVVQLIPLPDPFGKVFLVILVIILILALLNFAGFVAWPMRVK